MSGSRSCFRRIYYVSAECSTIVGISIIEGIKARVAEANAATQNRAARFADGRASGSTNRRANGLANGSANGRASGSANRRANGLANGPANGRASGSANRRTNGSANGPANGRASGDANRRTNGSANGRANGSASGNVANWSYITECWRWAASSSVKTSSF